MVGKTGSVDQKANARFERVRLQVFARRRLFARQGAVVAGWRTYRNRRLGPYFRLAYREGGRQRSIYLGRCAELARRVAELLARLQHPLRDRRLFARLKAQVRASLRLAKAELEQALAPWGIRLEGFEFRGGLRKVMQAYVRGRGPGARGQGPGWELWAGDWRLGPGVRSRVPEAGDWRLGSGETS
jgi:hypothetical protein